MQQITKPLFIITLALVTTRSYVQIVSSGDKDKKTPCAGVHGSGASPHHHHQDDQQQHDGPIYYYNGVGDDDKRKMKIDTSV